MQQNTPEWDGWRAKGIGASDAVVIMGVSPYKTPLELWDEKCHPQTYKGEKQKENFIHEKGHRLEKKARALFELATFSSMPTMLAEYTDWEIARCSMDGFNKDINEGIEIKYVGEKVFKAKTIPVHFEVQIQHQYMVTGAKKIDLVMYNDKIDEIKIIPVKPDVKFIIKMLEKEQEFWQNVINKKAPELSDKDFKIVKKKTIVAIAKDYRDAEIDFKVAKDNLDTIKATLLKQLPKHPRVKCGPVTVTKYTTKGSVDYSKIPALKGIDLEVFRKKSSERTRLSVDQPKTLEATDSDNPEQS